MATLRIGGLVALLGVLAGSAVAQEPPAVARNGANKLTTEQQQARRFASFLELPGKRHEAIAGLLRLGASSVPALRDRLRDPREDLVITCLNILRTLDGHAQPALPALTALQKSDNPRIARGATWTRSRLIPTPRLLVTSHARCTILTVDPNGAQGPAFAKNVAIHTGLAKRRPTDILSPYHAAMLANGNRLVVEYAGRSVSEVRPDGTRAWSYEKVGATDAERLPNGNTLICEAFRSDNLGRVSEVDPEGKVTWQWTERGAQPLDADRLPNGNTLIAESSCGKVIEVTPAGKVVWKLEVRLANSAQRLANGNTLVTTRTGAHEYDRKAERVSALFGVDWPKYARRLVDGTTLVADRSGLHRFDAKGKKRKTLVAGEVTRFSCF